MVGKLLRMIRAIGSELSKNQDEWPDLVQIVQSELYISASPQRGNGAPITAFTGKALWSQIITIRTAKPFPLSMSSVNEK